jgi:MoaA/NifB/PqqE/SkfB family radical SAM enzyme
MLDDPATEDGTVKAIPPFVAGASTPTRLYLEITQNCDSRCRLCDYWKVNEPRLLTIDRFRNDVVPYIERCKGLENITITGGEPTLHPDLVEICGVLSHRARSVTLVTSGSCLMSHFSGLKSNVSSYLLSVDGVDAHTYSSSRGVDLHEYALFWIRTIRRASDARVATKCVVQKANVDRIYAIAATCLRAGAHFMFIDGVSYAETAFGRRKGVPASTRNAAELTEDEVVEVGRQLAALERDFPDRLPTRKFFPQLLDLLRRRPAWEGASCDVPWTSFVLTSDGFVRPCFYMPFKASMATTDEARAVIRSVQDSMLFDPKFRGLHCDRCPSFISRRRPLDALRATHEACVVSLRDDPSKSIWGYSQP